MFQSVTAMILIRVVEMAGPVPLMDASAYVNQDTLVWYVNIVSKKESAKCVWNMY